MEKVFLGIVAGGADPEVEHAVRAVLDFIYYAHFEFHTRESLANLEAAWRAFHRSKDVFIKLGVRNNFNFAKLHSMEHYVQSILWLGAADGYNTEGPERLHIDFAKLGYRASNRKQYISQMTKWLERREAIHRFEGYLRWLKVCVTPKDDAELLQPRSEDDSDDEMDEDEDGHENEDEDEIHDSNPPPTRRKANPHSPFAPTARSVAKNPAFPSVKVLDAVNDFGAHDLVSALEGYLRSADTSHLTRAQREAIPDIKVEGEMRISAYKQVKLDLPVISQASRHVEVDRVRAVPAVPPNGRHRGSPAQFSTVLAVAPSPVQAGHDSVEGQVTTDTHAQQNMSPLRGS